MPKTKDGRQNNGAPPGGNPGAGRPCTGNTERITLRVSPALKGKLVRAAARSGRSLNDEMIARLEAQ